MTKLRCRFTLDRSSTAPCAAAAVATSTSFSTTIRLTFLLHVLPPCVVGLTNPGVLTCSQFHGLPANAAAPANDSEKATASWFVIAAPDEMPDIVTL